MRLKWKSVLRIDYLLTFEVGEVKRKARSPLTTPKGNEKKLFATNVSKLLKILTALIIVARVQPGTSKGITDLLLPHPSSVLKRNQQSP